MTRKEREVWGAKVIGRLSLDLVHEFPDMKGFFSQEPEIYAEICKEPGVTSNLCSRLLHLSRSIAHWHIFKMCRKNKKINVSLWTSEQFLRHHSSFLRPIKILIKTYNGEIIPFSHSILVSIIKIQMKSPGSISDL